MPERLKCRSVHKLPVTSRVPRSTDVRFTPIPYTGGVVEELINQSGSWRDPAYREHWFPHALERRRERLHVSDFPAHQKLERIDSPLIISKVDEPFVHDF